MSGAVRNGRHRQRHRYDEDTDPACPTAPPAPAERAESEVRAAPSRLEPEPGDTTDETSQASDGFEKADPPVPEPHQGAAQDRTGRPGDTGRGGAGRESGQRTPHRSRVRVEVRTGDRRGVNACVCRPAVKHAYTHAGILPAPAP